MPSWIIIARYNSTVQEINLLQSSLTYLFMEKQLNFAKISAIHNRILRLEIIAERLAKQL